MIAKPLVGKAHCLHLRTNCFIVFISGMLTARFVNFESFPVKGLMMGGVRLRGERAKIE